ALEAAMLFGCQIVGEAHISRKQYLDGSIPTGFQRTTVVGVNGGFPYRGRQIHVVQVALEEDSGREVKDSGHAIYFRTDRLGIPLTEVVTGPDLLHPLETAEAGRLIGHNLRLTKKMRRGIGSVRQDVNVSIRGGTRTEIKGVPRIPQIPRLVSIEAYRQMRLLEIRDEILKRGLTRETLSHSVHELDSETIVFRTPTLAAAHRNGLRVAAVVFRGLVGILGQSVQPGRTFAHEISGRVRVIACIDTAPNLFHTDATEGEFALTAGERIAVKNTTGAGAGDVVVILWGPFADVATAIEETITRVAEATVGVPAETRMALRNGGTDFERILGGEMRMYPDTDSPPTIITSEHTDRIRASLPEPVWTRRDRLEREGISRVLAEQLAASDYFSLYWMIQEQGTLPPNRVARVLVQETRRGRRKGCPVERISRPAWLRLFGHLRRGELLWEAVPALICGKAKRPGAEWLALASKQRMLPVSERRAEKILESVLQSETTSACPDAKVRRLMGIVQQPPGRIPASKAAQWLRDHLPTVSNTQ
ncbi:hypothetical protein KJ815_08185, partial [bacterium]|nr:hypothetical protein [bacterium]